MTDLADIEYTHMTGMNGLRANKIVPILAIYFKSNYSSHIMPNTQRSSVWILYTRW